MDTTFIYALCEPAGKIRYVGKADAPVTRFKRHLSGSLKANTYLGRWLRVLDALGEKPVLEILDEVPKTQWQFWEREYIRVFRAIGMSLVNTSDGGDGVTFTPEVREKMAAASRGKKATAEAREKMSRGQRNNSPETRAKKRAAHLGRPLSAEHRARISASLRGEKHPNFGKKTSDETRLKMSVSHKQRFAMEKS